MVQTRAPSALREAQKGFIELADSTYANKHLGLSGQLEVMGCDCNHHYQSDDDLEKDDDGNVVICGPESNCINRMTYMECYGDHCGCDSRKCANRRFQNHEHARIDIFKAGKKGFGVRALDPIKKGGFIYEYTGEVLDGQRFQRRQQKYERDGIKHFYFMMLQKDEFIDATEKGSLARFCNHSCNPNTVIEKWIVGPKIRMGLFAKRDIAPDEEICFDYKVDRYGSKPQACYCGEKNCSGFLGGRTQTGGALLPPSVIEGLGLDAESALGWHEKSINDLQRLIRDLDLENDLASVLNFRKNQNLGAKTPQKSPSTNASEEQPKEESISKTEKNQELLEKQPHAETLAPNLPAEEKQSLEKPKLEKTSLEKTSLEIHVPETTHSETIHSEKTRPDPQATTEPNPNQLIPGNTLNQSSQLPSLERPSAGDLQDPPTDREQPKSSPPRAEKTEPLSVASSRDSSPKIGASKRKTRPVDLLALLDAPKSLLNELQIKAQELLLSSFPSRPLTNEDLPEFMRILMHAQDGGWLLMLMLERVLANDSTKIQASVINMHGYEILGTVLNRWKTDDRVVSVALKVLEKWPKLTRNKIASSKIESIVAGLETEQRDPDVNATARKLLEEWSGLSMGYRIPRRKVSSHEPSEGVSNPSSDAPADDTGMDLDSPHEPKPEAKQLAARDDLRSEIRSEVPKDRNLKRSRTLPPNWEESVDREGRAVYVNTQTQQKLRNFPDSRELERASKQFKREQEEERIQAEASQKERERQANEIQRIIMEASFAESSPSGATSRKGSKSPTPHATSQEPAGPNSIMKTLAVYVPKLVITREKELGRERCKRHARDIVHILANKEESKHRDNGEYVLTTERKHKIKVFVKEYMDKVCSRHLAKSANVPV